MGGPKIYRSTYGKIENLEPWKKSWPVIVSLEEWQPHPQSLAESHHSFKEGIELSMTHPFYFLKKFMPRHFSV